MFMSGEQLQLLNRTRELLADSIDLNLKLLAGQILKRDAEEKLKAIAYEEIDIEKRLKEIEDGRKEPKENPNQINFDV